MRTFCKYANVATFLYESFIKPGYAMLVVHSIKSQTLYIYNTMYTVHYVWTVLQVLLYKSNTMFVTYIE